MHRVLEGGLLDSALVHAHVVAAFLLGSAHTELLFLVIAAEALRVLVQAREAAALLIGSDALHFDDLSAGQYVLELDGRALILLILDDFLDVLFHGGALLQGLVVGITLVRVLVALYMQNNHDEKNDVKR